MHTSLHVNFNSYPGKIDAVCCNSELVVVRSQGHVFVHTSWNMALLCKMDASQLGGFPTDEVLSLASECNIMAFPSPMGFNEVTIVKVCVNYLDF